jgi:pimeloyl-ACP methyl ester carboxylesterase
LPSAGSNLAVRLARKKTNATVTRFAGDSYEYFVNRGTKDSPGKIVEIVLSALSGAADSIKKNPENPDNKLIVIAHSFGGEIVYDILTYYAPDLSVDWFITVGSQVGLFEEMKLYKVSSSGIPADPRNGKVSKPRNVGRWLNVFDTNDVLSYRASPVFDGAEDFLFETGYSTFQAHGGYFMRPSFYLRLADRLTH